MNLKLSQKSLILMAVPFPFLVATLLVFASLIFQIQIDTEAQYKDKQLQSQFNKMEDLVFRAFSAHMLSNPNPSKAGQGTSPQELERTSAEITTSLVELKQMLKDRPDEEKNPENQDIESLFAEVAERMKQAAVCLRQQNKEEIAADFGVLQGMSLKMAKMLSPKAKLFHKKDDLNHEKQVFRWRLSQILMAGAVLGSILIAWYLLSQFNRNTTSRFGVLLATTRNYARGKELGDPLAGDDEIANLDLVFRQMASEISQTARMRKEFVATVTHELRSPLAGILLSMTMIGQTGEVLNNQAQQLVKRIERGLDRVVRLVNDMLDVEKLESGHMQLNFEELPTAFILDQAMLAIYDAAKDKDILLEMPEAESFVYGDGERLAQVLTNIMAHVIKSSPNESQLKLILHESPESVEFRVSDIAPKLSAQERNNVFDRYRGGIITLAFCREIVEKHAGQIGVRQSDSGNEWWFNLPAKQESKES